MKAAVAAPVMTVMKIFLNKKELHISAALAIVIQCGGGGCKHGVNFFRVLLPSFPPLSWCHITHMSTICASSHNKCT